MTITRSVVWIDATGNRTVSRINTSTGAATIEADIVACSTGDSFQSWEGTLNTNPTPTPAGGQYQPAGMKASLLFICADLTQVVLVIPAPAIAIFLADGETIDLANPQVAALVTACIGNLESASGSLAVAAVGGTLNAKLTQPL